MNPDTYPQFYVGPTGNVVRIDYDRDYKSAQRQLKSAVGINQYKSTYYSASITRGTLNKLYEQIPETDPRAKAISNVQKKHLFDLSSYL